MNANPSDKTLPGPGNWHTGGVSLGGRQQGAVGTGAERQPLSLLSCLTVYLKAKISNYAHGHQDTGLTELSVV